MQKAIRIILLILIIIGLVLLFTQKVWVPKLVNHIISSENTYPVVKVIPQPQPNISLADGKQCYAYSHDAAPGAPYTVNEFLILMIKGSEVNGAKSGVQAGPDMNNGYNGTLKGTLNKNTLDLIFSYTVEGSKNKEEEIYRTNKVGIEKLRYPLIEKSGILVPDKTKEFTALSYARVECSASN